MKPISKFHLVVIMDEQLWLHDVYVEFIMEMCNIHIYKFCMKYYLHVTTENFCLVLPQKNIVLLQC